MQEADGRQHQRPILAYDWTLEEHPTCDSLSLQEEELEESNFDPCGAFRLGKIEEDDCWS